MRGEDRRARSSDPRPLTDFRGRQLAASNRRFVTRRRTGKSLFPTIQSDGEAEPRESSARLLLSLSKSSPSRPPRQPGSPLA